MGSEDKIEKAHCPTCNREQNSKIHGRTKQDWDYSDNDGNSAYGSVVHTLYECRGCETVFYETNSWDDQDIDQWYDHQGECHGKAIERKETMPKPPSRQKPDWFDTHGSLDPSLYRILQETYTAFEHNCHTLAAIGLRTALDRCVTAFDIDPAMTFGEKLRKLLDDGWIGQSEHDLLQVLIDAGNAATHQTWMPAEESLTHLLDVLENFIQRNIVNGKRVLAMTQTIPKKQRRRKNAKTS